MERKLLKEQILSLGLFVVGVTHPQIALAENEVYGPLVTPKLIERPLLDEPLAPELLIKASNRLSLEDYLESISEEQLKIEDLIEERGNILGNIKNLSKGRLLDEFRRYFPMYKAGEIEYDVPWSMLMIIHAHETTFSSDPLTYNSLHVGAMQRARGSWSEGQIFEASENWEHLKDLPQRYPNDFREILWAARHIRGQAEIRYSYLPREDALLAVLRYNYSAQSNAVLRVNKYLELKRLLQVAS